MTAETNDDGYDLRVAGQETLAARVHQANLRATGCEIELVEAVNAAVGEWGGNGDSEDLRTDHYDNSIEVWGVGGIDLRSAAKKLHGLGFDRVWLHQHADRANCACPCHIADHDRSVAP